MKQQLAKSAQSVQEVLDKAGLIGHKNSIDLIYLDQELIAFDELWAAAGTPNSVFCIKSQDLFHLAKGRVVSI